MFVRFTLEINEYFILYYVILFLIERCQFIPWYNQEITNHGNYLKKNTQRKTIKSKDYSAVHGVICYDVYKDFNLNKQVHKYIISALSQRWRNSFMHCFVGTNVCSL